MTSPIPLKLDSAVAAGDDLDPLSDWPADVRISGAQPSRMRTWFAGQISGHVIVIPDGELRFRDITFDEICVVLAGSVTLTTVEGVAQTFVAGDTYVIPKGFDGVFRTEGGYRAMTVMSTEAITQLFDDWQMGVRDNTG